MHDCVNWRGLAPAVRQPGGRARDAGVETPIGPAPSAAATFPPIWLPPECRAFVRRSANRYVSKMVFRREGAVETLRTDGDGPWDLGARLFATGRISPILRNLQNERSRL